MLGRSVKLLTEEQILRWADAHHKRTGKWPHANTGPVVSMPGETWNAVNLCLARGFRGLPGGSSLNSFLKKYRCKPDQTRRPPLTIRQILAWADAHYKRTESWPRVDS